MALKIRLARAGRKKRPFYRIVVADVRERRDGRYIEKVGAYDPLQPQNSENRLRLVPDRITHWLGVGAKPTDRVAKFLGAAGLISMPPVKNTPKKSAPGQKAQMRVADKAKKAAALVEEAIEAVE